jgi:hypothetical protein
MLSSAPGFPTASNWHRAAVVQNPYFRISAVFNVEYKGSISIRASRFAGCIDVMNLRFPQIDYYKSNGDHSRPWGNEQVRIIMLSVFLPGRSHHLRCSGSLLKLIRTAIIRRMKPGSLQDGERRKHRVLNQVLSFWLYHTRLTLPAKGRDVSNWNGYRV